MRFTVVSRHLPEPEGSAAGRVLHATCSGLLALGHEVAVTCWRPQPPRGALPAYCTWSPLPPEPAWRTHGRALLRPRFDAARLSVPAEPGTLPVADDPLSWPAVRRHGGAVATVHYATALDLRTRRPAPRDLQDLRAERRAAREASAVLAYSPRVAAALGRAARWAPAALAGPSEPLPSVAAPVAGCVADWCWPPNQAALATLLSGWTQVRAAVPGARLLLAGRGDVRVGALPGVEVLGPVADSAAVLARLAVLAFPVPASSGPKVKVLEALAYGVPVLTTAAGVEGVGGDGAGGGAAAVSGRAGFPAALAALLADGPARRRLAAAGRRVWADHHAPVPAAQARIAALGLSG